MSDFYRIAIAIYERTLATFARRAGESPPVPLAEIDEASAAAAMQLALPGFSADEGEPRPLQSILGRLFQEDRSGYYAPKQMANDAAMPDAGSPDGLDDLPGAYQQLWRTFAQERDAVLVAGQSPATQEANLHALLQRYCWSIPAPGADDVSLYDFARVSAALAVCLADDESTDEQVALLVGADLSGVQDWLYTFSSSGAAKSLRGRSFYLQLLMEVIALYLLDELGLPRANLLYVGGGNFYLLAPVSVRARVQELRRSISSRLLSMHRGELYVAIAAAPVSAATLQGSVGNAWGAVNRGLNRQKSRRFAELTSEEMGSVIGRGIGTSGMEADVCAVCRRGITAAEKDRIRRVTGPEERFRCAQCVSFEDLGNDLRRAHFLALTQVAHEVDGEEVIDWQEGLRQFGYAADLLREADDPRAEAWRAPNGGIVNLFYWDAVFDQTRVPGAVDFSRTVVAFRPLAQCVPSRADGEIATFKDFESEGIDRWGVLRMDVDRLGEIFRTAIPASDLSHVVALSGLMRLFFEGTVPALGEGINREKDGPRLYLMYAGGDDLFVVGGWSDLPELADRIRRAFADFACHNPQVSISAGISIALSEKYPLYQAARAAGDAEHAAKSHEGKNALSFLGEVVPWSRYAHLHDRVQTLAEWLHPKAGRLPRSFLGTLRTIDAEWRQWTRRERAELVERGIRPRYSHGAEDPHFYLGPWQWHLVYSLKRAAQRTRDKALEREIDALAGDIVGGEIHTLGLVARWTELLTRRTEKRA